MHVPPHMDFSKTSLLASPLVENSVALHKVRLVKIEAYKGPNHHQIAVISSKRHINGLSHLGISHLAMKWLLQVS
jgi:hypothetical protein